MSSKLRTYLNSIVSNGPGMTGNAQDILERIRGREKEKDPWRNARNPNMREWCAEWREQLLNELECVTPLAPCPPTPDEWQRFKSVFVEEYGGERVEHTGMTHREFLDYMRTGEQEGDPQWAEWIEEQYWSNWTVYTRNCLRNPRWEAW